jgi:hypothetical protein
VISDGPNIVSSSALSPRQVRPNCYIPLVAGKHSNGGRIRWILCGIAALIVVAAGTGVALALTGSSGSPPVKEAAARHSTPPRAATPPKIIKVTPKRSPSPSAATTSGTAPSSAAAQPQQGSAPQQSSAPQQDCYAPPHPTCTPPPAPSSLLNSPYVTDPTPTPVAGPTISETP